MNRSKKLVAMALKQIEKDEAASKELPHLSNSSINDCASTSKDVAERPSTSRASPLSRDLSSNESSLIGSVSSELEKVFISDDSIFDKNYKPSLNDDTDSESDQHVGKEDGIPEEKETKKSTPRLSRQKNKSLRVLGQSYQGYKGDRGPRIMKPKNCDHDKTVEKFKWSYMCGKINEGNRKAIFQHFWSISSWDSKKAYLQFLVEFRMPTRRRKNTNLSDLKKQHVYDCYLPKSDGTKLRVCRSFFLCTLDIKKDSFSRWVKENNPSASNELKPEDDANRSNQAKLQKDNKQAKNKSKLKSDSVLEWLNILPKVESHYCRASSSRQYVESTFNSVNHMHTVFKEWCQDNEKSTVERKKFCEIMKKEKISIFHPRKDQCDTCVSFKEGNLSEEEYRVHMTKKEEARMEKQDAIANLSDETLVVTMDVQSVLLSPKLLVSKQYYSQKLQVHNFTLYISNNKDVHLYVWSEENGHVTSNEFTSCIIDFMQKHSHFKKIVLISDGCAYQNKNRILASALSDLTRKSPIEIEQIILEKGHTMMEVDSVHSTLEQLFKPPIDTPSHYVDRMGLARKKQPYVINYLDYNFFKNYEGLPNNFSSIRPGKKTGDPTVTDIRGMRYHKGDVFFKLRHSDNWTPLPQRRLKLPETEPAQLYSEPKKIDKNKLRVCSR